MHGVRNKKVRRRDWVKSKNPLGQLITVVKDSLKIKTSTSIQSSIIGYGCTEEGVLLLINGPREVSFNSISLFHLIVKCYRVNIWSFFLHFLYSYTNPQTYNTEIRITTRVGVYFFQVSLNEKFEKPEDLWDTKCAKTILVVLSISKKKKVCPVKWCDRVCLIIIMLRYFCLVCYMPLPNKSHSVYWTNNNKNLS